MNHFTTDRQRQAQRDNTLLSGSRHGVILPGDYTAVLITDIRVPLYGTFPAGTRCEVSGDTVRFNGGRLVLTSAESGGVMHPALSLVEQYVPPMVAMVRSPYTGQLVLAESGTGRRVLGK